MSKLPDDLLYTETHEWIRVYYDGTAKVGITDYAQESLGSITFVEFPEVGATFEAGDVFGVIESVKAASDLNIPISGEVIEINAEVDKNPELVNDAAFTSGWLIRIRLTDETQLKSLMKSDKYGSIT